MKIKSEEIDYHLLGTLVISKAGRDSGHYFVITSVIDREYVTICDGKFHLFAKPKKKKLKHLKSAGIKFESIGTKLMENKKVFDSEVFSAIKKYLMGTNGEKTAE